MKLDLHCHTIVSDGALAIPELYKHAMKAGLGGLVITDHCYTYCPFEYTYPKNLAILETLNKFGKPPIPIILGCEIATPWSEFLLFGHSAIKSWYDFGKALEEKYKEDKKLYFKKFKKHVLAGYPYAMAMCHPTDVVSFLEELPDEMYDLLDGYEVVNSGIDWRKMSPDAVDFLRSKVKNPRELENSDCHWNDIGSCFNEIDIEEMNEKNLIEWFKGGEPLGALVRGDDIYT